MPYCPDGLGYQLIEVEVPDRLLNIMCLVAIVPAFVGIAEQSSTTGHARLRLFAVGAASAPRIRGIRRGGAGFRRVPSTFSFVAGTTSP
jgi:hypothetical protein